MSTSITFLMLPMFIGADPAPTDVQTAVAVAWAWKTPEPANSPPVTVDPGWRVTGKSDTRLAGTRYVYWAPLGRYAHVHESLLPVEVPVRPFVQSSGTTQGSTLDTTVRTPIAMVNSSIRMGGVQPGTHTITLVPNVVRGGIIENCGPAG